MIDQLFEPGWELEDGDDTSVTIRGKLKGHKTEALHYVNHEKDIIETYSEDGTEVIAKYKLTVSFS